jgi:putative restriction endonuclease
MDLFAEGSVTTNLIEPSPELYELFTLYWSRVMPPNQRGILALPYFHLQSDGFWHLVPQPRKATLLKATKQIRSAGELEVMVAGARLDDELYEPLCVPESREMLRAVLIETYFSEEVRPALMEQGVINVEAFHRSEELLNEARKGVREMVDNGYAPAVRDQAFRRAVVIAYDHRCAFCGIRVLTAEGHTAVEAAHIIPWSVSHNDLPTNGLGLCGLCHWTFDEGLFSVSDSYVLLVSPQLGRDNNLPGHLALLRDRSIFLPEEEELYPERRALHFHRNNTFQSR